MPGAITSPDDPRSPIYGPFSRARDNADPQQAAANALVNQYSPKTAATPDPYGGATAADLIAQAMGGVKSASSSSGGRRGGGGGGGGGGAAVNQQYIDALKAYIAQRQEGMTTALKPYDDMLGNVNTAVEQGRADIGNAGAMMDRRLADSGQQQSAYNDILRSAYATPPQQYDTGALMRDLAAQGVNPQDLQARVAQTQAQQAADAARRSQLAEALVGSHNADLSYRGDIAHQVTASGQDALSLAALAAQQQGNMAKTQATTSYQDAIEQLKLELAKAGGTL